MSLNQVSLALATMISLLVGNIVLAETPDDKALIIQLDELTKRSLRLSLEGDIDGLKAQLPWIEEMLQVENISGPCREATSAKLAAARANISFLQAKDGSGQSHFAELQEQNRKFHTSRRECLGGRMEP